jgi:hypothetical protein
VKEHTLTFENAELTVDGIKTDDPDDLDNEADDNPRNQQIADCPLKFRYACV